MYRPEIELRAPACEANALTLSHVGGFDRSNLDLIIVHTLQSIRQTFWGLENSFATIQTLCETFLEHERRVYLSIWIKVGILKKKIFNNVDGKIEFKSIN